MPDTTHEAYRAAITQLGAADDMIARVLDLAGVRALGLDALLRLSCVAWSDDVATACVECSAAPRLLLNPCFVASRCADPRALAFLVLHELAHVSLGHTGLHTRVTPAQNVAFDAVINASLLHGLVDQGRIADGWDALVMSCYAADRSPEFLLRPPPGWPETPDWAASAILPPRLRAIHRRLYGDARVGTVPDGARARRLESVTYGEIVDAVTPNVACDGMPADDVQQRLLGAHGATATEQAQTSGGRDTLATTLLADVLERLPRNASAGRGSDGDPFALRLAGTKDDGMVRELRALLHRALIEDGSERRFERDVRSIITVDPSRDRRAHVRRYLAQSLGAPDPLLHRGEVSTRRLRPAGAAVIYLDVSDSMGDMVHRLHAALVPLRRLLAAEVYVFSTTVERYARDAFISGRVQTTGGTDITPVLKHLTALATSGAVRRALLLTDGDVGTPSKAVQRAFHTSAAVLHVGIVGSGTMITAPWAASVTRLEADRAR